MNSLDPSITPRNRLARLWTGTAAALVTAGLLACGDDPVDPEPPPDPVATTVQVSPATATLASFGETVQLTATVLDQNGNTMAGATVAWASGSDEVATVDASGLVTAVFDGSATITATSGAASGSATVTVQQAPGVVTVTPETLSFSAIGEKKSLMAAVADANGNAMEGVAVTWSSGDEAVATVDDAGMVSAAGNGTASVTATAGSASGSASVTVMSGAAPSAGPPAPMEAATDVISIFSDAYDDVTVDTWSAEWDQADLTDLDIAGDAAKLYTNLAYAGIEFTSMTVDASAMNYLRMDIWTPDATDAANFKVKLVDFGDNGVYDGGGDDSEHEVWLTAADGLASESWVHLDLYLGDFSGLASTQHLAQLIISGDGINSVYVDNVYFRAGDPPTPVEPTDAAPTPTHAADDVISLFSDEYTDVTVDTWSADWDVANVEDVEIAGNATKKYTGLSFAGIEFTSMTIDASDMTHFRFDMWTPDPTVDAAFKVKLVDFGDNGVWDGGGDDSEHEVTLDAASTPGLATGEWVSYDLDLSGMTNLAARAHLAQLVISGDPNTVYLDNIYFRK